MKRHGTPAIPGLRKPLPSRTESIERAKPNDVHEPLERGSPGNSRPCMQVKRLDACQLLVSYIYPFREPTSFRTLLDSAKSLSLKKQPSTMLSRSTAIFRSVSKTPVRAFTVSAARTMPARSYVLPHPSFPCASCLLFFLLVRRQVSDADPKALEDEKKKNLSGTQKSTHPEDAPGWNEVLAVSFLLPLSCIFPFPFVFRFVTLLCRSVVSMGS